MARRGARLAGGAARGGAQEPTASHGPLHSFQGTALFSGQWVRLTNGRDGDSVPTPVKQRREAGGAAGAAGRARRAMRRALSRKQCTASPSRHARESSRRPSSAFFRPNPPFMFRPGLRHHACVYHASFAPTKDRAGAGSASRRRSNGSPSARAAGGGPRNGTRAPRGSGADHGGETVWARVSGVSRVAPAGPRRACGAGRRVQPEVVGTAARRPAPGERCRQRIPGLSLTPEPTHSKN